MSQLIESSDVTYSDGSLFFELGWRPIGSSISAANACHRSIMSIFGFVFDCRLGRFLTTSAHDLGVVSGVLVIGVVSKAVFASGVDPN